MLLTELTELIVSILNDTRNIWKPANNVVTAVPVIDWVQTLYNPGLKVLVVPELNQYIIDESNTREKVKVLSQVKYVSVLIGFTFTDPTLNNTAATWAQTKMISDTREHIENIITTTDYSTQKIALVEVEAQPIEEQELNRRNFNAVTSFGFENLQCGYNHELTSTTGGLRTRQLKPQDTALVRQQALSQRKLGRRSG